MFRLVVGGGFVKEREGKGKSREEGIRCEAGGGHVLQQTLIKCPVHKLIRRFDIVDGVLGLSTL